MRFWVVFSAVFGADFVPVNSRLLFPRRNSFVWSGFPLTGSVWRFCALHCARRGLKEQSQEAVELLQM